jgi:predicted phosphodiesterase
MRTLFIGLVVAAGLGGWVTLEQRVGPVLQTEPLKFAVIGDNGTGEPPEYDVGRQLASAREKFPFEMVLMLGDNMYGRQQRQDFVDKFEKPYAELLQAGVPFYAALGNHDNQSNRFYPGFNMQGERYYTFVKRGIRFFVLDTNLLDPAQLAWFEDVLKHSQEARRIVTFHHPLYSDGGRHGSNVELRVVLEPLLVRHAVAVVFSGHEHIYERTTSQNGITYFVEGSSGQLRKGDVHPSEMTAAAFAEDRTFMLVEIDGEEMRFQTISRTGQVVDSGVIRLRQTT